MKGKKAEKWATPSNREKPDQAKVEKSKKHPEAPKKAEEKLEEPEQKELDKVILTGIELKKAPRGK